MRITVNNISLHYEVTGNGKWLTLIHGAQDNLEVWWNQIPVLSKHYQVLTYDWRGHGETETPPIEYTFEILVQDLYELLRALNVPETYLLGHSMGGGIAVRMALEHPEMVKALILANSGVAPVQHTEEEEKQMMEVRRKRWDMIEKHGLWPYADDMALPPSYARYKAMRLKNDPHKYVIMIRTLHRGGQPPDVSTLKCPTLIISGEHDDLGGPERAGASQKLIAGSKLVILPTGHVPAVEQPDKFNKTILDFLAGLPARA